MDFDKVRLAEMEAIVKQMSLSGKYANQIVAHINATYTDVIAERTYREKHGVDGAVAIYMKKK